MTVNEVKREIDGATQMFQAWEQEHGIRVSPSVHFTGGEPFLYNTPKEDALYLNVHVRTIYHLAKRGIEEKGWGLKDYVPKV